MAELFKFPIGALVQHVDCVRLAADETGTEAFSPGYSAQAFRVVGRIHEECYGGVQVHYDLRALPVESYLRSTVGIQGAVTPTGLFRVTEPELQAYVARPPAKHDK